VIEASAFKGTSSLKEGQLMNKVPMCCRDFREDSVDERLNFAKGFLEEFVRDVAPPKGMDKCKVWTESVRRQFVRMCPEDCELAQRGSSKEYLVDSSWMETGHGKRVLLACECEWASDRYSEHTLWGLVEEDFEKLLAIKAPFKVLIFSAAADSPRKSPDLKVDFSIEYARECLKRSLENYWHHLAGETYIFIDFPATGIKDGNGEYRAFAWIAKEPGMATVDFEDLGNGELRRSQGL
jgi:hypothetical protein